MSLVVHWLRICLQMQGTWVWTLLQEATRQQTLPNANSETLTPQLLKPTYNSTRALQENSSKQRTCSVQFSHSVMSDSLWQHARTPCPSPAPGVYSNSCPLSLWCHPAISSSVIPFSYSPQSFQAPGSFQMSQFFTSGGQSTGVSVSTSVLPMNTQHWSPLGWTGWISLQSKGLSRVFSNTTVQKHQFCTQLSL